jgi:hypothetical protein
MWCRHALVYQRGEWGLRGWKWDVIEEVGVEGGRRK